MSNTNPRKLNLHFPARLSIGYLFLVMLVLSAWLPTFPNISALSVMEYMKFLLPFLIAVIGLCSTDSRPTKKEGMTAILIGLLFLFLTILAILLDSSRVVATDFLEIFKPIDGVVIFLFSAGIYWSEYNLKKYFWKACAVLLISSLILVGLDISNSNIFAPIVDIYIRNRVTGKAVGFFYTTYFAASIYILLGSLFTGHFLVNKTNKDFLFALFSFFLVFLTQSRSAFIALFITFLYISLIFVVLNRSKFKPLFKFSVFCILLVVCGYFAFNWIQTNLPYLFSGLEHYVLNFHKNLGNKGSSLNKRYNQILWAFENNDIIITGVGIGKGYNHLLESFYALYYYRYGLIGIISYLFTWGFSFVICLKGFNKARDQKLNEIASFFIGFNIFIISLPFISLSSVITDQPLLIPIYYGTIGVAVGAYRYVRVRV